MSQENVELVRTVFDETRRRGDPTPRYLAEYFDAEVEFHDDPRAPEAGLYRGVEEVLAYWEQFIENFEEFKIEPEEFVDIGGERVLVLLIITTRGRGSSASVTMRIAWTFTVRDRLITRIEAFAEREEALKAAGLSE
jgi:ketosteroid isomerase-like protein